MSKLYNNTQIRDIERLTLEQQVDTEFGLMQKAAAAALIQVQQNCHNDARIVVCCGKGNNGGDGLVLAALAKQQGYAISVYTLTPLDVLQGAAKEALNMALGAGVECTQFHPDIIFDVDFMVDALLGSGISGEVQADYAACIEAITVSNLPCLSIDVPSGIDVNTGEVCGVAVKADITVTFIGMKQGLLTCQAPEYCGEVVLDDLQIPPKIFDQVGHAAELIAWNDVKMYLPRRRKNTHKGDFGHTLIVGGDYGMGGAVRMAAEAALRVGSGLVTVATRPEHLNVVSGARPEIMCHEVAHAEDLRKLIERCSVIVIGPGLGQAEWSQELLLEALDSEKPKLLDADALNLLSKTPRALKQAILTPHPGEAGRLLDVPCNEVQQNRFLAAEQLQQKYQATIVLKGLGTIIQNDAELPRICSAGNPGMASGGMGDVLSGVIGGLLAQGLDTLIAAEAGVMIHSIAADLAAEAGGERGLLATDLLEPIRVLANP